MSEVTLEKVIHLADQLSETDRLALLRHLKSTMSASDLETLRTSVAPKGVPGASLLRFVGMIPADDLQKMATAIQEDLSTPMAYRQSHGD